jgi:hypothetical protein
LITRFSVATLMLLSNDRKNRIQSRELIFDGR